MNEITLLREAGPEAPALAPAARSAARAALLAELDGPVRRRRRRPSPRTRLRLGAGILAVAAAWATAVAVTGEPSRPVVPPSQGEVPRAGIELVDFDSPVVPLALPAVPPGTTGPVFGGAGGRLAMSYVAAGGTADSVHVMVGTGPVDPSESGLAWEREVAVGGQPALLAVLNPDDDLARMTYLEWQRTPDQSVMVTGAGRYSDVDTLVGLAESLVDSPQVVPIQLHVAPAGWRLDVFKDDGRFVRLAPVDGDDPYAGLNVRLPFDGEVVPADRVAEVLPYPLGPVQDVTVQGRAGYLVPTQFPDGRLSGWYLQAVFPDGTAFVVEAPALLTAEQVVEIADGVSYTP
jgi:hypothetical protein